MIKCITNNIINTRVLIFISYIISKFIHLRNNYFDNITMYILVVQLKYKFISVETETNA